MTKTCDRAERRGCAMIAVTLAGLVACGGSAPPNQAAVDLDSANVVQWKLPKRLKEISGLAFSADERLFAHDDERAVIYQIDWQRGNLVKSFALGDPPLRDDFEAIAIAGDDFYLMTSNGILYRAKEGDDGAHVPYTRIDTGLGAQCEIEGLTWDARRKLLLVACKTARTPALKGKVAVIAWSPDRQMPDPAAAFAVPVAGIADRIGLPHFNPSSIEISRDGTRLWLLAGRQAALAQVGLDGEVVSAMRLPAKLHPQPEGLAIAASGEFIISDEAAQGRGTLVIYRPR